MFVIPVLLFVTSSCYHFVLFSSPKFLERCKCQHMKAFVVYIGLVPYPLPWYLNYLFNHLRSGGSFSPLLFQVGDIYDEIHPRC